MNACDEKFNTNVENYTCILKTAAELLSQNFSERKFIPVPFTILLLFFSLSVVASKMHRYETFVPGCLVSFCGVFEFGSWITILALSISKIGVINSSTLPILVGVVCNIILNLLNLMIYRMKIYQDPDFAIWISCNHTHKVSNIIIMVF